MFNLFHLFKKTLFQETIFSSILKCRFQINAKTKDIDDLSITMRLERIKTRLCSKETASHGELGDMQNGEESEESDQEIEADWPMIQIDLREWFLRHPHPKAQNETCSSNPFAPRVTSVHLMGSIDEDRLALAVSTGCIYVCQLAFDSEQLHSLYVLQKPSILRSLMDSRIESISSSSSCSALALWQLSSTDNSPVKTDGTLYSSKSSIFDQSSKKEFSRLSTAKSSRKILTLPHSRKK